MYNRNSKQSKCNFLSDDKANIELSAPKKRKADICKLKSDTSILNIFNWSEINFHNLDHFQITDFWRSAVKNSIYICTICTFLHLGFLPKSELNQN